LFKDASAMTIQGALGRNQNKFHNGKPPSLASQSQSTVHDTLVLYDLMQATLYFKTTFYTQHVHIGFVPQQLIQFHHFFSNHPLRMTAGAKPIGKFGAQVGVLGVIAARLEIRPASLLEGGIILFGVWLLNRN
jgi:hypothetical protein